MRNSSTGTNLFNGKADSELYDDFEWDVRRPINVLLSDIWLFYRLYVLVNK